MEIYKRINELLGTEYKNNLGINWEYISRCQKLSESFIREFQDEVWWGSISMHQKLSEDFIRKFQDKIDWEYISKYQKLSECFIREFHDKVNWRFISISQKLSEDFVRKFQNRVHWTYISIFQKLSESFIREFRDKVNWSYISKYQRLSEKFIKEYEHRVDWKNISAYQKLSECFIKKFRDKLDHEQINNSWLYKDTEYKKQVIIDTGLYECHDDYFIAHKGIRSDRYSRYNFQYKYEPGNIYESWCDCSSNINSFGLSVWTEQMARYYCNEFVVKAKVRYEDVGRVVHDGGKIRCFKIEILD